MRTFLIPALAGAAYSLGACILMDAFPSMGSNLKDFLEVTRVTTPVLLTMAGVIRSIP